MLLNIILQHWLVWRGAHTVRQAQHRQYQEAEVHHNTVMAHKCLQAWGLYVKNRRAKVAHAGM